MADTAWSNLINSLPSCNASENLKLSNQYPIFNQLLDKLGFCRNQTKVRFVILSNSSHFKYNMPNKSGYSKDQIVMFVKDSN